MKASGTNTATSTSAIATIGPDTSRIARCVARRGDRPASMLRSTFSTTTMASSTTMPIASTSPNKVSALIEKPKTYITAKVPMIETATANRRNKGAPPRLQEQDHHQHDQRHGLEQRVHHRLDRGAYELGGVIDDLEVHTLGHVLLQLGHGRTDIVGDRDRVRARRLEHA